MNSPFDDGEEIRLKSFRAAQNRISILMFIMLVTEFAASTLMIVLFAVFPQLKTDTFQFELMQALLYLSYVAVPVLLYGVISGKRLGNYFSFKRGRKHTVAVGFAAMGAVYFAQLVATVVSYLFESVNIYPDAGIFDPSSDPAVLALRFVYIAVFPAIFEELMTRGIVLRELLPYGKGFAIITSGAIFGLMHMNPLQLPFAFIAGVAMAYAVVYCGSLRVSVAVHFANNFISVLLTALPEFLPEDIAFYIEALITFVIFAAGSIAAIWLMLHKDELKEQKCVECNEPYKVDLRENTLKKISPMLYVYAAATVTMALVTLFTTAMAGL